MASQKETVIYVTRDIERALGMQPNSHYHIVSNRTIYGEKTEKLYPGCVTLIDDGSDESAGTGDLMSHPATAELFAKIAQADNAKPYLLIFKNTARIEPIARAHNWTLINPPAATSEKIENKISQVMWLAELERLLPPHRIEFMKNVRWDGKPFILQWAHGHTGGGTLLIDSSQALEDIRAKFPDRRCRVTTYIEGPSFTMNVVVAPEKVLPSAISYQITGLPPFTDSRFATIGNDWGLAAKILSPEDKQHITDMAMEIGARMQKEYWRGLFGIDVIKETATGKIYLIEINARQPASTTFESRLQEARRAKGATGMTTFEAHLAALLGHPLPQPLIEVADGAQIIQRVTKDIRSIASDAIGTLELDGFTAIPYENTDDNSDLLRIQSDHAVMQNHGELNEAGQSIAFCLQQKATKP